LGASADDHDPSRYSSIAEPTVSFWIIERTLPMAYVRIATFWGTSHFQR